MATIGTVVRVAGALRHAYDTLRSAERQTTPAATIVVVTDTSTAPTARDWVRGTAVRRGWRLVHAEAETPGAAWNAGVAACATEVVTCLDAGDRMLPTHNTAVLAALGTAGAVALPAMLERRIGGPDVVVAAAPVDLASRVERFDAARHPWTVRRAAWDALGGADAALEALEDHEFLLRAVLAGLGATTIAEPLGVRLLRRDRLHLRSAAAEAHAAAVSRIVARHPAAFAAALDAVVAGGLQQLSALAARNTVLVERRAAADAELTRLRERAAVLRAAQPAAGRPLDFGALRRTSPVARDWGYERGGPVDRPYIENFLAGHADDIRGAVLEIQEADYTTRFGGGRVVRSDVLDVDPANPRATVIGDLRALGHVADDSYDCVILTQTAHVIDDLPAVAAECARVLAPGGVLLATLPCVSRVSVEYGPDGDFWRVTEAGARQVFASAFEPADVQVESLGNVLTTTAFLHGLGASELTPAEYAVTDPFNPMLVAVRATKRGAPAPVRWRHRAHLDRSRASYDHAGAAVLLYHRIAAESCDLHRLAIAPEVFNRQIAWLHDEYDVVPLAELGRRIRAGTVTPGLIALTFDDGCLDNLEVAAPALATAGLPATFFVTTGGLDSPAAFWWDALEQMLMTGEGRTPEVRLDLPGGTRTFAVATASERLAAHWAIHQSGVDLPAAPRNDVLAAVANWRGHDGRRPAARCLSAAEVRRLAEVAGVEIGAHSVQHLVLPSQEPARRRDEIVECRRTLETLLGRLVTSFAYPFGAWDHATRDEVAAAGYDLVVACGDAAVPRHPDRLAIPRLDVGACGFAPFDEWLRRHVSPPRRSGRGPSLAVRQPATLAPGRAPWSPAGSVTRHPMRRRATSWPAISSASGLQKRASTTTSRWRRRTPAASISIRSTPRPTLMPCSCAGRSRQATSRRRSWPDSRRARPSV